MGISKLFKEWKHRSGLGTGTGTEAESDDTDDAAVMVPLTARKGEVPREDISLKEWLRLSIDQRAPVRSVVMVEIRGDMFGAIVLDTVVGRELWRIFGESQRLHYLLSGMSGTEEDGERDTLAMVVGGRASSFAGPTEPPCWPDCNLIPVTPTPVGDKGPPGDWPWRKVVAQLLHRIVYAPRIRVQLGKLSGEALLLSVSKLRT